MTTLTVGQISLRKVSEVLDEIDREVRDHICGGWDGLPQSRRVISERGCDRLTELRLALDRQLLLYAED